MVTEFIDFCATRGHKIPDEIIDEFFGIKEGDMVRVTKEGSHHFKVGEIVEIRNIDGPDSFQCANESDYWWLSRSEFQKI